MASSQPSAGGSGLGAKPNILEPARSNGELVFPEFGSGMMQPTLTRTAGGHKQIAIYTTGGKTMAIKDDLVDTKLKLVEARTQTGFVELSSKIDRLTDTITLGLESVKTELSTVKSEMLTVKADNKYTRLTIVIAIITSVLAGIGALWVTQANLLSAFQTGILFQSQHSSTQSKPAN